MILSIRLKKFNCIKHIEIRINRYKKLCEVMVLRKGFVFFNNGKIPFVIEDYRLELFTDDEILGEFTKEYNFKSNYILRGQYFRNGIHGQPATFLIECSIGSTCYLKCYIVNMLTADDDYDTIGLQSLFLDDVFRYNYEYIDSVRAGINLTMEPIDVYNLSFSMGGTPYNASYRIGYDNRLGLLEDRGRKGEVLIPVHTDDIWEVYNLSMVFYRLAMFMTSHANVPFKRITLYKSGHKVGWFFCPFISENAVSGNDVLFHELDVMKYVPKILNNIALDSGSKITQSVPLGHLSDFDNLFSPHRFMEQVIAFEYLFDKIDHKRAQDSTFHLKNELRAMFDEFPELLSDYNLSAETASDCIKTIRHSIAHGHKYYYDFKNDTDTQRLIFLLDKLFRKMSLLWIGFTKKEIDEYPVCW